MSADALGLLADLLNDKQHEAYDGWMAQLAARPSAAIPSQLSLQLKALLRELNRGLASRATSADAIEFAELRNLLAELSAALATQGFSPREIASMVLALKQPLFKLLQGVEARGEVAIEATQALGSLIDEFGLLTVEAYQRTRESIIVRQQQELSELSTPVIKLWPGILALPLIGTLDSQRTQVVMENLLQAVVQQSAGIAIIDITGVPVVDTLTAQHLLKTVAAARLMGAECIISGIRPQIAQTMVHLGIDLNVVSKASLADALALALSLQGRQVVRIRPPEATKA